MEPLTEFIDTPAVQRLMSGYGTYLTDMPVPARLHLMQVLSGAAAAVEREGASERLDVALQGAYPDADRDLLDIVRQLDSELADWPAAVALVSGIAQTIV